MTAVVIACGENSSLVDALSGGPLAADLGVSLLLTASKSLPAATAAEIRRLGATTAYIIGQVDVVSQAVETALRANGITTVVRLGGSDRYATAVAVSKERFPDVTGGPVTREATDRLGLTDAGQHKGMKTTVTEGSFVGKDVVVTVGKQRALAASVIDAVAAVPDATTYTKVTGGDVTAPTMPTNVVATGGIGTVSLTWTASTDAVGVTGYRVYRDTSGTLSPPTSGTLVGTPTTNSFNQSGLAAGTYYYRVAAYDAAGNISAYSPATSATVSAPVSTGLLVGINGHTPWMNDSWMQNLWPLISGCSPALPSMRVDINWASIEPTGPTTLTGGTLSPGGMLTNADYVINRLATYGIKAFLVLSVPDWGESYPQQRGWPQWSGKLDPATPANLGKFAAAMVHRYGTKLDGMEIINEPGYAGPAINFSSDTEGTAYANMVRSCYIAIKAQLATDGLPDIPVANGSTLSPEKYQGGSTGIEYRSWGIFYQLAKNNVLVDYVDALNIHGYPGHITARYPSLTYYTVPLYNPTTPRASLWGLIEYDLKPDLTTWGAWGKPIFFTEFGWNKQVLSDVQQGDKYREINTTLAAHQWQMNLQRIYPYQIADAHTVLAGDDGWGICRKTAETVPYPYAGTDAYTNAFRTARKVY